MALCLQKMLYLMDLSGVSEKEQPCLGNRASASQKIPTKRIRQYAPNQLPRA